LSASRQALIIRSPRARAIMCAAVAQVSFDRGRGITGAAAARRTFVFAEGVGLVSDDDDDDDDDDDHDDCARDAARGANIRVVLPCAEGVGAGCERYGSFTWPSAVVLAQAVWHNADAWVTGKAVLELGAGEHTLACTAVALR
jgi:hypothetical protein